MKNENEFYINKISEGKKEDDLKTFKSNRDRIRISTETDNPFYLYDEAYNDSYSGHAQYVEDQIAKKLKEMPKLARKELHKKIIEFLNLPYSSPESEINKKHSSLESELSEIFEKEPYDIIQHIIHSSRQHTDVSYALEYARDEVQDLVDDGVLAGADNHDLDMAFLIRAQSNLSGQRLDWIEKRIKEVEESIKKRNEKKITSQNEDIAKKEDRQ